MHLGLNFVRTFVWNGVEVTTMLPVSKSRDRKNNIDKKPAKQRVYYLLKTTEDIICMEIPCFRKEIICLIDRGSCS